MRPGWTLVHPLRFACANLLILACFEVARETLEFSPSDLQSDALPFELPSQFLFWVVHDSNSRGLIDTFEARKKPVLLTRA